MMYVGDIMIHLEYIEGCSVHQSFQYKLKAFINYLPKCIMISSQYTDDIPLCTENFGAWFINVSWDDGNKQFQAF